MFRHVLILLAFCSLSSGLLGNELDWEELRLTTNDRNAKDDSLFPEHINDHVGQTVTVRGYMMVSSLRSTSGIRQFGVWAETTNEPVNVHSWMTLPLHHVVFVRMVGDATTDFISNDPVEITGKLEINVWRAANGEITCVYEIRATQVVRAKKRPGFNPAAARGC